MSGGVYSGLHGKNFHEYCRVRSLAQGENAPGGAGMHQEVGGLCEFWPVFGTVELVWLHRV